jgi:hypothetical protein
MRLWVCGPVLAVVTVVVVAGSNDSGSLGIDYCFIFLVFLQIIDVWPRSKKKVKDHKQITFYKQPTLLEQHGDAKVWEFGEI